MFRKDAARVPLLADQHLPFPDDPLRDEIFSDGAEFSDAALPAPGLVAGQGGGGGGLSGGRYVAPRGPVAADGGAAIGAGGAAGRRGPERRQALRTRGAAREKKARRKNIARQVKKIVTGLQPRASRERALG